VARFAALTSGEVRVCIIRRQRETSRSGRRVSSRKARKALLFIQSSFLCPPWRKGVQFLGGNEVSTCGELAGSSFPESGLLRLFSCARTRRAEIGLWATD